MRRGTLLVVLCVGATTALVAPGRASAAELTLTQGTAASPFRLVTPIDSNIRWTTAGVALGVGVLASIPQRDPESVQALAGGDVLAADAADHLVAELAPDGSVVRATAPVSTARRAPACSTAGA